MLGIQLGRIRNIVFFENLSLLLEDTCSESVVIRSSCHRIVAT